jgi:type IX secretion system PorP/SprF family membrane protein
MKKLLLFLIVNVSCFAARAQQKPYYTQYILNNYIINPGFAGIENYSDVKFSYRNQWEDLDGAPVTTYLTFHKPFGKSDTRSTPTSMQSAADNPYLNYGDDFSTPSAHHGVGLTFISDKTGYVSRNTFGLTYAYHKPVSQQLILSAGLTAGFTNVSLDRTKIVWGSLDPNDPAIGYNTGDLRKVMPELGVGIVLYDSSFFLSASALNIVPGKLRFVKNDIYGDFFKPHVFLQTGYKFYLNNSLSLIPSVSVQFINPLPVFVHLNAKLNYENLFWVGAGYRLKDELSGMAVMTGINLGRSINLSYSYNSTVNGRLKTYVGNTHEVVVGITIGKKPESCPTSIW